jgi:predicted metal-binding membrane protein
MPGPILETLLRRDRWIVAAALAVSTVLAWAYVLWLASAMTAPGSPMPAMPGMSMDSPSLKPWDAADFGFTFAMWAVMMIGMMTPSAAPMILIYARVARQAELQGKPLAASGWFFGGYLLSWTAFSLAATALQGALQHAALLTPMMALAANHLGGAVLIAAGLYQWTRLKDSCLQRCRSPLAFIQDHGGFKRQAPASLKLGFHHGLYCIGCCWALMALLFVGGVMNIVWIAAIAVLVLVEKAAPKGRLIARIVGILFIAAGARLIAGV